MANSIDPDQTAPVEQSVLGPRCLLSIFNSSVMLSSYLQQTTSADFISDAFFLGVLRANTTTSTNYNKHK